VALVARTVLVQGESQEDSPEVSGVYAKTTSGLGDGGNSGSIDITATESVRVLDGGVIAVSSERGGGFAGDIVIRGGGSVEVADGGQIKAEVLGSITNASLENASDIRILDADQVIVASRGKITAETWANGFGGTIAITAAGVHLSENAQITAKSTGIGNDAGPAGNISITQADEVSLDSGATLTAETSGTGAGGSITLSGTDVSLAGNATITAQTSRPESEGPGGDGGSITVRDTQKLTLDSGATVTAETAGTGAGGSIALIATDIALSRGASVTTSSTGEGIGSGNAGDIQIAAARNLEITGGSSVTTTAANAAGGNVELQAGELLYFLDSTVETNVIGDRAEEGENAGDIDIPFVDSASAAEMAIAGDGETIEVASVTPRFVVVNRSVIRANANNTDAGNVTIEGANVLVSSDSVIEATSQTGLDGIVEINAPDADIVSQITPLPAHFVDPSDRLLPPCVARTERTGSFVVQNRERVPPPPDAPLSALLVGSAGGAVPSDTFDPGACPASQGSQ
jgi:large exoprotein involved in heme utilization and adhesion